MFARLGTVVTAHPWRVIGVWIAAAAAIVAFSPGLPTTSDESDFLPRHYESIRAESVRSESFPAAFSPSVVVVFHRSDGRALAAGNSRDVRRIAAGVREAKLPLIERVVVAPPSPNRLVQTVSVQMPDMTASNQDDLFDATKALRQHLERSTAGTALTEGTTGSVAQGLDQKEASGNADTIVAVGTVALIVLLLLVIFRSPIVALLPVLVIGLVAAAANGLIAFLVEAVGLKADASISSLLIVVLFGIGTDYILFLLFRYRERLRRGEERRTAMVSAVGRVGEAISSAAGVVIVAFLAMTLSSLSFFRSMGPSLAVAVAVTLVAGLTLVPAVVSLLGPRVFWPSKSWQREPRAHRFGAIGATMARRPAAFAAVSGFLLLALALGALRFNPTFDLSAGSTPKTAESQVALRALERGLPPGSTSPTDVYLRSDSARPLERDALAGFRQRLRAVDGVGAVAEPRLSRDGRAADFSVTLRSSPESDRALDVVAGPLRDVAHGTAPAGSTALVGGITSVFVDIKAAMNRDYKVVFPVAALAIMLILALLLRSLVAPLYLMLSVGLGFAATLGATTLIFQDARGESGLIFLLPLIMYMFVVALGTDYNILMMARLREEAKEGHDARAALATAIRQTAPTIAAAGVILAGSFAVLMLAGNSLLAEMGFAIAFGIAVAAFAMATFFTPALTALVGRAAWWPGHRDASEAAVESAT
ncbi:MAG TPA: MMPL family transporter [Gaiellaceae bacterium]|nr:MMPL family transporter [Gaiellaceae bacterium]